MIKSRYFWCYACGICIQRWSAWEQYRIRSHKLTCKERKKVEIGEILSGARTRV